MWWEVSRDNREPTQESPTSEDPGLAKGARRSLRLGLLGATMWAGVVKTILHCSLKCWLLPQPGHKYRQTTLVCKAAHSLEGGGFV